MIENEIFICNLIFFLHVLIFMWFLFAYYSSKIIKAINNKIYLLEERQISTNSLLNNFFNQFTINFDSMEKSNFHTEKSIDYIKEKMEKPNGKK